MGGDCFKFANTAAGIGLAAQDGSSQVAAQASAYAGLRPAEMRHALTYWPQRDVHRRRRLLGYVYACAGTGASLQDACTCARTLGARRRRRLFRAA
jgi:hypothetical protein